VFAPQIKFSGPRVSGSAKTVKVPAALPAATKPGTALVRGPMKDLSGPLQFWRLSRRLELQRAHGRLLIHGNGYWK